MSYKKTHDITVKTGSYTDRDGNTKGRYENVGQVLSDGENTLYLIKRTFNPAGVPNPEGKDSVLLSMFEDKPREDKPRAPAQAQPDLDDDIPF